MARANRRYRNEGGLTPVASKREKSQKHYEKDIIQKMTAIGTYRPEFQHAIDGLARALLDRDRTQELFDKSGGQIMIKHTNKAGATNAIKNPFYLALETLRQDIIIYSRELGLTPSSLKRINESSMKQTKRSKLAEALHGLAQ